MQNMKFYCVTAGWRVCVCVCSLTVWVWLVAVAEHDDVGCRGRSEWVTVDSLWLQEHFRVVTWCLQRRERGGEKKRCQWSAKIKTRMLLVGMCARAQPAGACVCLQHATPSTQACSQRQRRACVCMSRSCAMLFWGHNNSLSLQYIPVCESLT